MRIRWAWEQIRPRLGQVSLVILVIALAVGLSGGVLLANNTLQRAFETSIDALAGSAEIQVAASGAGTLDQGVLASVREVPGVAAAAPLLLGTVFVAGESNVSSPLRVIAVDMLDDATIRLYRSRPTDAVDDPLIFLNQPNSVLSTEAFMSRYGLERGDSFSIQTPAGIKQLKIRGVLANDGVGLAFGGNLAVMDLYAAQELLGLPGTVSQIDVRVDGSERPADVVKRLRHAVPAHARVELVDAARGRVSGALAGFQLLFDMIAGFSFLLGALITANRLATVYEARQFEVGIVRAQGMSSRELLVRLMGEAAFVAAIGASLGVPLAIGASQLLVGPLATAMTANFRQEVAAPWVQPSLAPLALASIGGLMSGLIAAWIPASRATRLDVAQVLVRGRSRAPWPEGTLRRRARLILPIVSLLLLALLFVEKDPMGILGPLAMAAIGVAGFLLIQPGLRLVGEPLSRLVGEAVAIGLDDQGVVPTRAIGAGAVLMVGGAVVIFVSNTGESFERYVVEATTSIRHADLVVDSSANVMAMGEGEPRLSERILPELGAIEGVSAVAADVAAALTNPDTGILGVEPVWLRRPEFGDWKLEAGAPPDALERVARGEAFLVNFPPSRPVRAGEKITLMTPSGPLERSVAAITRASSVNPGGDVILSRDLFRKYWNDTTINRAYLILEEGVSAAETAHAIRRHLGGRYGLRIMTTEELSDWLAASVRQAFAIADAMGLLTLVVVLLGTADALGANVLERTREIGTMRSLGCPPGLAAAMILAQALGIGIVGVVLASIVGIGWSVAFVKGVVPPLLGWQVEIQAPPTVIALATGLGVLACLVGAVVPAARATRLSIAAALRYD